MTANITKWIGSSISTLEEVDIPKDGTGWGHFIQMRVKIEVTKPLQQDKKILIGQANLALVSFKYERLPAFPTSLGGLGWKYSSNPTLVTVQQKHKLLAGAR